ncbi:MAG: cytochrome C oxidase subunit IV family protein [Phycisphaerae bacterium]|nr:cytochrome C oxidase subunit IV family protein [Phycisphaerae bacterium]
MADRPQHAVVPYGVYLAVWAGLIALTGLTLGTSYLHLGSVGILTALLIAVTKASLVLLYFMHLRYEGRMYFTLMLVAIVTYAVFLALTFSDYGFRP